MLNNKFKALVLAAAVGGAAAVFPVLPGDAQHFNPLSGTYDSSPYQNQVPLLALFNQAVYTPAGVQMAFEQYIDRHFKEGSLNDLYEARWNLGISYLRRSVFKAPNEQQARDVYDKVIAHIQQMRTDPELSKYADLLAYMLPNEIFRLRPDLYVKFAAESAQNQQAPGVTGTARSNGTLP